MQKETLYVRIPVWLGEWLDEYVYGIEVTKSDVVRELLILYYEQNEREGCNNGKG